MHRDRTVNKVLQSRSSSMRHCHHKCYDVTSDSNVVDHTELDDIDVCRIELGIFAIKKSFPNC